MNEFVVDDFLTYTIAIVVFFIGFHLNKRFALLRRFNIPEPVTGGLLAAAVLLLIFAVTGTAVTYELETRDRLLVYFFVTIGLNARFSDLIAGGRPLLTLIVLTLTCIVLQDAVGLAGAALVGAASPIGVLAGSASLIGGHGTAIAWAPEIVELGIDNALEIGMASATLGLVLASLIGGPIARFLIKRHSLSDEPRKTERAVGISYEAADTEVINYRSIMAVLLAMHISILIGHFADQFLQSVGFKLPFNVTCLLVAIVLSNTVPKLFPRLRWPARTRALALVSDFSLSLFLAMSLMSMQLWSIAIGNTFLKIVHLKTLNFLSFPI